MSDILQQSPDGVVRESLSSVCTDSTARDVAHFVVETMRREADDDTLEFDFHISGATGGMSVSAAYAERNTWFKFDTRPGTILAEVKKAMYEADCNVTEYEFIDTFCRKVCNYIEQDFSKDVEHILRDKIFKGKNTPCRLVKATLFEMIDFSGLRPEENYHIIVEKRVPQSQVDQSQGVANELFQINIATGKGFNQIVREKQAEGDPKYTYVTGVTTKKMYWECQLDMFVDYSNDAPLGTPDV